MTRKAFTFRRTGRLRALVAAGLRRAGDIAEFVACGGPGFADGFERLEDIRAGCSIASTDNTV
jgi:hypothetical protein